MSVIMGKIMTSCDGRKMEEIMNDLVRAMEISKYSWGNNEKLKIEKRKVEKAVDMYELAPQMFDKEADRESGMFFKDCDSSQSNKERNLANGFEIIKQEGKVLTYRRPFDDEVFESYYIEPVYYTENGNAIMWYGNYSCNQVLDQAISLHFPEIEFEVLEFCEGDEIAHYHLKNNEVVKDYLAERKAI